jgi:hypothetical protein
MNERIDELLKQSRTEYWTQYTPSYDYEKFAELIVKECSDLFEIEWGEEKLTGNDVGYVLKKHFGIEE